MCGIVDQDTGLYNQNVGEGTEIGVGDYHKVSNCELNEFCTGPFTANTSILAIGNFGKKDLCTKGTCSVYIEKTSLINLLAMDGCQVEFKM